MFFLLISQIKLIPLLRLYILPKKKKKIQLEETP